MPLTGDTYDQRTEEEILAFLESELRSEFGEDIDLTESSAFRTFAAAISGVDATEIEPALESVHQAAFLESADGENLDKLVAIAGITRRSAVHATGTVEFRHSGRVTQNYTISNGTIVQTASGDPVEFETTDLVTLSWFDDFESGSLRSVYSGDTAGFTVVDGSSVTPNPTEGSFMLQGSTTNGDHVHNTALKTEVGDTFEYRVYVPSGATVGLTYGVQNDSNYYRIRLGSSTHDIEKQTSPGGTTSLQASSPTVPTGEWLTVEVEWLPDGQATHRSRVYDSNDDLVNEVESTGDEAIVEGGYGFESLSTTAAYFDHSSQTAALANIRAREGGTIGNVGANTLTEMPSVPNGVAEVTNPHPTGDDEHRLTDLTQYSAGVPRESDEELRDRAAVSPGRPGKATIPALIADMTALPGAQSVSVYENDTDTDNTGSGGLPPKSFEVVFYGTTPDQAVADQLFETAGFTARDYGGAHGTAKSQTVEAENGQTFPTAWTEPTEVAVDMTLDIVVNDEFIGKDALRDRIAQYVGGTLSDGTTTLGTGTGEDVYVDQIEDIVTGPDDTGVIGISSYSFTPTTTTDGNGLEVVSVGANEVANTNGQDGSISLTVTQV